MRADIVSSKKCFTGARGLIGLVVALLAAAPAAAAPALGPFPIAIENQTGSTLSCYATAGHWYGFDLGSVPGGKVMRLPLSLRPADGTLSLQNSLGQPVPIQMIYCGDAGRAYDTRTILDLQSFVARGQHSTLCTRAGGLPVCR